MAFNNFYENKKVLVTGHTGFKGGWLCKWLKYLGAEVHGVSDQIITQPCFFEALQLEGDIGHHLLDIRKKEETIKLVKNFKPDVVFHLAAQAIVSTSYENPTETFETNVMGTINILEALRVLDSSTVGVFITSDKCYDNVEWPWGYRETDHLGGKDIYSGSKGAAELAIKSYFHSYFSDSKTKIASARAGNVIGGGDWAKDRIVPDAIRSWSKGEAVKIRSPKATRPWQHVMEPLSGYLALGEKLASSETLPGEAFNFGPNFSDNITVNELLQDLANYWPDKLNKFVEVVDEVKFHEAKLLKLNCDKALLELKWQPTLGYDDTIKMVGNWYETYFKSPELINEFTSGQISQYTEKAKNKALNWTN